MPVMIEKVRGNAEKPGFKNLEFREGAMEYVPVGGNNEDVVVSNCVLNLVPNKKAVFSEIYRVLKPAGHFSVSDIVLTGNLPEQLLSVAEMYAGCVAGAIQMDTNLSLIREAGFQNITVQKTNLSSFLKTSFQIVLHRRKYANI